MVSEIQSIKFGDREIKYSIARTARKTIGIIIEPDGKVIVKAPMNLDQQIILDTIQNKRKWIAEKLKLTEEIKKPIPVRHELVSGEKILLKNRMLRLKIHPYSNKRSKLSYAFKTLHIYINENLSEMGKEDEIKRVLINWYKDKALSIISDRINIYLNLVDFQPQEIKIRDQKIRWGSCTMEGKLIFNWRIVMAPISAIDYVIVHELCHVIEPTHSAKFWEIVESIFPKYRQWKEWLRINGRFLDLRI